MSKVWMLVMVLVCSAAWLVAQDQSAPAGSKPSDTSSSGQSTSIEGCLQGSSGSFTLTDNSGMTYQLAGDTSKLAEHVGHEVSITGTVSGSSSGAGSSASSGSAPSSSASGATAGQTLTVDKVQHKSKTCKSNAK